LVPPHKKVNLHDDYSIRMKLRAGAVQLDTDSSEFAWKSIPKRGCFVVSRTRT
jgi:hypothetical protein